MSTPRKWTTIREYEDILFDYYNGIARITINRERYRNAFTPTTTAEMSDALRICREEADIDVIVITGAGDKAFCSGGDQNVKGRRKRICYRWWPCASRGLRLVHCFGKCHLRTDRSPCRQL